MTRLTPVLDHLVIDVHDQMDRAVQVYRALGFRLTERGHHTLGSINHLAIFGSDYIELLGFPDRNAPRNDIAGFPRGLNGLVFKTDDADAVFAAMQAEGYAAQPARSFSRPVALGDGVQDAKFRTTHMPAGSVPYGRLYFCEHLTPELVWRPEWQRHPNGVTSVARVVVAARNPAAAADAVARLFGASRLRTDPDGSIVLPAGDAEVAFAPVDALAAAYGDALADAAGRADFMAAIVLRTRSFAQAMQALTAGGIASARQEAGRIVVPARDAMNVTLVFAE